MAHLQMVYLLNMVIFHGYVSHNQMVTAPQKILDDWSWCLFYFDQVMVEIGESE